MGNVGALTSLITKVTIVINLRTYVVVHVKCLQLLPNFNQHYNGLKNFCEMFCCFYLNLSDGSQVVSYGQTGRQTDRRTGGCDEDRSHFSQSRYDSTISY
jgi:hypothetical protein